MNIKTNGKYASMKYRANSMYGEGNVTIFPIAWAMPIP
jgi:hypothetical protein